MMLHDRKGCSLLALAGTKTDLLPVDGLFPVVRASSLNGTLHTWSDLWKGTRQRVGEAKKHSREQQGLWLPA